MNSIQRYIGIICFTLFCMDYACGAQTQQSVGQIAENLTGPVDAIISLVRAICVISGLGLVMGSLVKFSDHRKNPQEITLGMVFMIFLAGMSLLAVAFIPSLVPKTV